MPPAQTTAGEYLDARAARRLARLLDPSPVLSVYTPDSIGRAQVERYIARRFESVHGARIHDFMPALLTMGCGGRISAATGVRAAAGQRLFLEQYLSSAVEDAVSQVAQAPIRRAGIAEIGNLVATQGGSSYLLFLLLTAVLERAGFEWVVFTATPQVRKAVDWLGLRVDVLCTADPSRLTRSSAAEWGRYYACGPVVVAGQVSAAMAVLRSKKLYTSALSLFQAPITELAEVIVRESVRHGTCTLAA